MRRRRVFALGVVTCLVAACNALTGAGDLHFDEEVPDAATTDAALDDVYVAPVDALAKADAADAADVEASTCTPSNTVESVTSSPTFATNGTQVGSVKWTIGAATAEASLASGDITNYLVSTAFGFDALIPDTAAIDGFVVTVTRSGSEEQFSSGVMDSGVALVKNLLPGAPRTAAAAWPDALAEQVYGTASDLWAPDKPWTAADVRSPTFGVAVAARGLAPTKAVARITAITVKVFFVRCPLMIP